MAASDATPHWKGEVVPIIAKVTSETEPEFYIVLEETICQISTTSGEIIERIPVTRMKDIAPNEKNLYASWDTNNDRYNAGFYKVNFWVAISLFGEDDPIQPGHMIVDAKILSDNLQYCLKNL